MRGLVLLLCLCASAALTADDLDDLGWLVGRWIGTQGATVTVEVWQRPMGSVMLGTNQTVRDGRTLAFEFLRIEATEDGLHYIALPGGGEGTRFTAVRSEDTTVVFEAPEHDYPQRIVYRRTGDLLSVRIEALDGERRREWIWRLARR